MHSLASKRSKLELDAPLNWQPAMPIQWRFLVTFNISHSVTRRLYPTVRVVLPSGPVIKRPQRPVSFGLAGLTDRRTDWSRV